MIHTFEALQILLFLAPGFLSIIILNILVVRKERKVLEKITDALIFSLLIYIMHSFVSGKSPVLLKTETSVALLYDWESFLWLLLFALCIPLIVGFFVTNDYHMKLARTLKISRRTARNSVWLDVFSDFKKHIIINFENGRRIYGWPMYYSDNPENQYIFLSKPAWVVEDEKIEQSKYIDLDIEGILITSEQKIESIEFLKT